MWLQAGSNGQKQHDAFGNCSGNSETDVNFSAAERAGYHQAALEHRAQE